MEDRLQTLLAEIDTLGRQGQDIQMIPVFREAIAVAKEQQKDKILARIYNDFGGVLRNTGNYGEGEKILTEAKKLVVRLAGRQSQAYVTTLLNAGTLFVDAQNYLAAREDLEEALSIAEQLELRNLVYASICNNLGILNLREKNYEQAYLFQKKAMHILRTNENSRVKLAIACSNFAETCKLLGNTSEYMSLLNEAKTLLSTAVGENHPLYAMVVNNLATTFYKEGRTEEAIHLLEEALAILEKTYGKESKGYKAVQQNLDIVKPKQTDSRQILQSFMEDKLVNEDRFSNNYPVNQEDNSKKKLDESIEKISEFYDTQVKPILEVKAADILPSLAGIYLLDYSKWLLGEFIDDEGKLIILVKKDKNSFSHINQLNDILSTYREKLCVCDWEAFCKRYTDFSSGPNSLADWRCCSEENLAYLTTSTIIFDNMGELTKLYNRLLSYYPDNLRKKHIAYYCLKIAQSGQYNYPRLLKRGDTVAASLALKEFMVYSMQIVFAINRKFARPTIYQYDDLLSCPVLGMEVHHILQKILTYSILDKQCIEIVENLCKLIIQELHREGLSKCQDTFLLSHGMDIVNTITNLTLKQENPWIK